MEISVCFFFFFFVFFLHTTGSRYIRLFRRRISRRGLDNNIDSVAENHDATTTNGRATEAHRHGAAVRSGNEEARHQSAPGMAVEAAAPAKSHGFVSSSVVGRVARGNARFHRAK